MEQNNTTRRYPRLTRVLLAMTEESDLVWASKILESKSQMSKGIIREAYKCRHGLGPAASRVVERLLGSIENPAMCQVCST